MLSPEQRELIEEGKKLEHDLGNGHRGDAGTMSDAIRFLIRSQRILLFAEAVSDKECRSRMSMCPGAKPVIQKPAFTWPQAFAWVLSVGAVCTLVLQVVKVVWP
jgi:hypothetical protein